jgi:hypothetical protein
MACEDTSSERTKQWAGHRSEGNGTDFVQFVKLTRDMTCEALNAREDDIKVTIVVE